MAALTMLPGEKLDLNKFAAYVTENLTVYARPHFIRISKVIDATSSFKQIKSNLQKEGFNPDLIKDPLYFLDPEKNKYVKITKKVYDDIEKGVYRF